MKKNYDTPQMITILFEDVIITSGPKPLDDPTFGVDDVHQ